MGARGPKSAAELATVTSLTKPAPEPLPELSDAEARAWRRYTQSKPGDWFNLDDLPLLAELCRAVVMCDRLAGRIDKAANIDSLQKLLSMRDKEARRVTVLATKLRLTPQSRYDKGAAATAAKRGSATRPWDRLNPFDTLDDPPLSA